jgi:hypothetical protein
VEPEEIDAIAAEIRALVARVGAVEDAEKQMVAAHRIMRVFAAAGLEVSAFRTAAANRLRAEDVKKWTYAEIARKLDLTSDHARQDAQAIVKGNPAKRARSKASE